MLCLKILAACYGLAAALVPVPVIAMQAETFEPFVIQLLVDPDDPSVCLPVSLELTRATDIDALRATIINGPERIDAGLVENDNRSRVIEFAHFDSRIRIEPGWDPRNSDHLNGTGLWIKQRGPGRVAEVPLTIGPATAATWQDPEDFCGRWSVEFGDSDEPAVAVFEQSDGGNAVHGTFLTTTGDYRYLAGGVANDVLTLSCFDGAHAFLFVARMQADGSIEGSFRSGNWHQSGWTAHRNPQATLPDAFQQTVWTDRVSLSELKFPDVDGNLVALDDSRLAGKCRIIEVFGTWCPNCHDAGRYLNELHNKYSGQGLAITGLAFEMTGDFQRDAGQVRRFIEKTGTAWPILIAGTADKELASERLPILDRVRSYPTLIFMDQNGTVIAIYTGFSGPATGAAHQKLRQQFESIIRQCLAE